MLHSIKHSAIQLAAVALLTAGAAFPLVTSAAAAPAGVRADRGQSERMWYAAPSDEDACLSSPGSLNHTICKDTGGGE